MRFVVHQTASKTGSRKGVTLDLRVCKEEFFQQIDSNPCTFVQNPHKIHAMKKTTPILISLAVLLFTNPVSLLAATDQELQKEYEQARKIALKDPKVRAAYDRAEETLNDRVVSIDPTLKPYVEKRRAGSQVRQEKVQPAKHAVVSKKQPEPTAIQWTTRLHGSLPRASLVKGLAR